jgi:D-alanine--poly(phosphoribitol) ligase subunit 1
MKHYVYNLGHQFDKIVNQFPNHVAIRYPEEHEYTYATLDKMANGYAHYLASQKIKTGDVIAIFNDKSVDCFAIMLACLKLGITYTNLDINSPEERITKIVDRCNPKIIFVDPKLDTNYSNTNAFVKKQIIFLNELQIEPSAFSPKIHYDITGGTPAYIMFTSGSTGFPKGAVMSHANVLNLIYWGKETFGVTEQDICTNVNPVYFDNSVFDFYNALFNGAILAPFDHKQTRNPHQLVQQVEKVGCTIWFSVPSMLVYLLTTKAIEENSLSTLRKIIFGGEGFPKPKLKKLYELVKERTQLINVYGPTECTCICSSYAISDKDLENLTELAPLGKLAPNFGYEIIPQNLNEPWIGELCLKGPNVGMGYYNDTERTQASFIQNPFNKNHNEIIYKTGDLVELDQNGEFHFLGRVDNQIKHMGYRIELEEIEAGLNTIIGVKESAVVYKKLGDGLGSIIGFVATDNSIEAEFVMEEVKKKVPEYMVPKKIYTLNVLPKNSNGKIDRVELKKKV